MLFLRQYPIEEEAEATGSTAGGSVSTSESGGGNSQQSSADTGSAGASQESPASQGAAGEKGAGQSAKDGTGAESSTAKGEQQPKTALQHVDELVFNKRAQAEKEAGKGEVAEKTTEGEPATDTGKQEPGKRPERDLLGRIPDTEWKAIPTITRERIGKYREMLERHTTTLKAWEPKAKAFDDLQGYVQGNMSQDNFNYAMSLMANVKGNPVQAWKDLQPLISYLQEQVGEALPQDLQAEVEKGTISEAHAKELARTRKDAERATATAAETRAATERSAAVSRAEAQKNATLSHLQGWENQWKASDTDYSKKWESTWERMVTLGALRAATPQEAIRIAQKAREDIESRFAGFAPAPRQIKPGPTGGSALKTVTRPKNALEAADRALASMGRA